MSQPQPQRVLLLCTGNYYRSRFAEMVFNHHAGARGLGWRAVSRGLRLGHPGNIGPISPHAAAALSARGITCDQREFPRACEAADLSAAQIVIAMKQAEHSPMIQATFARWAERVQYWHVHDVDESPPQEALRQIEELVHELVERLLHFDASGGGPSSK